MTYAELGQHLGVSPETARAIVRRRRWPIAKGNDGKARVTIAEGELEAEVGRIRADVHLEGSGIRKDVRVDVRPDVRVDTLAEERAMRAFAEARAALLAETLAKAEEREAMARQELAGVQAELGNARERAGRAEAKASAAEAIVTAQVEAVRTAAANQVAVAKAAAADQIASMNAVVEAVTAARDDLAVRLDRAEIELKVERQDRLEGITDAMVATRGAARPIQRLPRPWWRRLIS